MAGRGSYAVGRARREEILDAAFALFLHNGYDRTSVREIARAVGLTQTGVLHHFANKEELFTEVLRRRDNASQMKTARRSDDAAHPIEGLVADMRDNASQPGLVRLFVAMSAEGAASDSPARGYFEERYREMRAEVTADVRREQAAGTIAADLDPQVIATVMIAAADGLQIQWLLSPQDSDMGEHLGQLWDALKRVE